MIHNLNIFNCIFPISRDSRLSNVQIIQFLDFEQCLQYDCKSGRGVQLAQFESLANTWLGCWQTQICVRLWILNNWHISISFSMSSTTYWTWTLSLRDDIVSKNFIWETDTIQSKYLCLVAEIKSHLISSYFLLYLKSLYIGYTISTCAYINLFFMINQFPQVQRQRDGEMLQEMKYCDVPSFEAFESEVVSIHLNLFAFMLYIYR